MRLDRHDPRRAEYEERAVELRRELMALSGDPYGEPKRKMRRPDYEALEAEYACPEDVPDDVWAWVCEQSILTGDATDAVRWARIAGTVDDDRYPDGEMVIYRATDSGDEIRAGDWVTSSREYAEEHLRRYLDGAGVILEAWVDGRDVLVSPTGNYEEAIYAPLHLSGPRQARAEDRGPTAAPGL